MTPAEIVARALSAIGRPTRYKLGAGGGNPQAQHPASLLTDRSRSSAGDVLSEYFACDCSGFAAWCLGVARWVRPGSGHPWLGRFQGEWIETSQLARSARAGGVLVIVADPMPGDLIVYGDSRAADGRVLQGHVGIVTPAGVCHCSKGNEKKYGDAIRETPIEAFWHMRGAIYARVA